MSHHLVIHYRGHVIRERSLGEGIFRYVVEQHGHSLVSDSHASPAPCRTEVDACLRGQWFCEARRRYDSEGAA